MRSVLQNLKAQIKPAQTIESLLHGDKIFCDLTQYNLHHEISDLQPDSALLCIAIAGQDIAQSLSDLSYPALQILNIECERIIEEYGPLWLKNARSHDVDTNNVLELLQTIPEDFASLIELLTLCSDLISDTHDIEASLLDILCKQSSAHSLIAEEYLEVLGAHDPQDNVGIEAAYIPNNNNNIIQFPLNARA